MDREPGDQRRATLRASDADRERVVEQLRQHHVEGRLTVEELSERTERAYAARTLGDLDAWPPTCRPSTARPAPGERGRPRWPRPGPRRRPGRPRPGRPCSGRCCGTAC